MTKKKAKPARAKSGRFAKKEIFMKFDPPKTPWIPKVGDLVDVLVHDPNYDWSGSTVIEIKKTTGNVEIKKNRCYWCLKPSYIRPHVPAKMEQPAKQELAEGTQEWAEAMALEGKRVRSSISDEDAYFYSVNGLFFFTHPLMMRGGRGRIQTPPITQLIYLPWTSRTWSIYENPKPAPVFKAQNPFPGTTASDALEAAKREACRLTERKQTTCYKDLSDAVEIGWRAAIDAATRQE